jgi:hypothetical protein
MSRLSLSGTRLLLRTMRLVASVLLVANLVALTCSAAVDDPEAGSLNKPERLEWFRDQGFGLFIHWSVDSQLGVVISHSLVGASPEYTDRFFQDLPKTFDPHSFDPLDWARLARLAGVRYVMFTTQHHSGFAMFIATSRRNSSTPSVPRESPRAFTTHPTISGGFTRTEKPSSGWFPVSSRAITLALWNTTRHSSVSC